MNLQSIFNVWKFPRWRMKLYTFGPIRVGYQLRDRWRFRIEAPIRSELGIRFCGFLIDYFGLSIWIYIPALRIDPPPAAMKTWYRVPKGR